MTRFRMVLLPLAVLHALFVGLTAMVGAFANGGDIWQRLVLVLLHPLGAIGVTRLALQPDIAAARVLAIVGLLTANVIADLWVARLIATGAVRGDWELAMVFSVVPAVGIVYALGLLRTSHAARP